MLHHLSIYATNKSPLGNLLFSPAPRLRSGLLSQERVPKQSSGKPVVVVMFFNYLIFTSSQSSAIAASGVFIHPITKT